MICRRKRPPPMTGGSRRWKNSAFPASGPKKRVEKKKGKRCLPFFWRVPVQASGSSCQSCAADLDTALIAGSG